MRNPRIESAAYQVFKEQAIPVGGTLHFEGVSLLGAESSVGLSAVGRNRNSEFFTELGIIEGSPRITSLTLLHPYWSHVCWRSPL